MGNIHDARLIAPAFGVFAAAMLTLAVGAAPADAQSRTWSATNTENDIVLTDCRDCGDDIGLIVKCQGPGRPARVFVPWAAVENGEKGGAAEVTIAIDGKTHIRRGTTDYWGMVGYLPRFELGPNDPLVEALQAGQTARISFAGQTTDIGLRGSRIAFRIFKAHCDWTPVSGDAGAVDDIFRGQQGTSQPPTWGGGEQSTSQQPGWGKDNQGTSQPPTWGGGEQGTDRQPSWGDPQQEDPDREQSSSFGQPARGPADENGAAWFTNKYTNQENGREGLSLIFGIPETDAIAFVAQCEAGNPGPFIPVQLLVELGGRPSGVPVEAVFSSGGQTIRHRATVFADNSEWAGAQVPLNIADPVWNALQSGQAVTFGLRDERAVTVPTRGAAGVISSFQSSCRSIFGG